ncbi:hypothetical protein SAMN05216289_11115 [Dokdonella immobilis]|uniref:DUF2867 domain-containing protein n=2 Tax=Dokdonella immobilis TaxID=578942 RepID=A0A1I4XPV4_9GAMM|nr:hypothetical protein SAMN05216289_11115 [Dokdonella immobilis]
MTIAPLVQRLPKVSQAEFVSAFYTTGLFRLERWILSVFARRPSSDEEAFQLARGERDRFAAWQVEQRSENELLLCDFSGRTRSWLMTEPTAVGADSTGTLLRFGSAVVSRVDPATGTRSLGTLFHLLLGFHRLYSRLLLRAACARLRAH